MKKIFITGGRGFIGRNLTEGLKKKYIIYSPQRKELDLLDSEKVKKYLRDNQFDLVIHCATWDASRNSNHDLNLVFKNNLRMFFNLVQCNKLFTRMYYFGSGAEYDKEHYLPKIKEEYFGKYIPNNDYGFSKYIMSKQTSCLNNVVDLRIFGCFGKYEDYSIRFISNAICKVIFGHPITIKQNVFFDYLYVEDLVKIMELLIEKEKLSYKHYNVCTGQTIDLLTIAQKVVGITKKKLEIKVARSGLKSEYSGDISKLMNELGKFEFTTIDKAISKLYHWYKFNKYQINSQLLLADK